MPTSLANVQTTLDEIRDAGLYKNERLIDSPQRAHIEVGSGQEVLNMCANNYLGLADNAEIIQAAHDALDRWGYGMSSVRFICGTQTCHKELEEAVTKFLATEDTILYSSCFDANGGLFETLLTADDAIISDELNHASIIDGVRLAKAKRFRYKTCDMDDLRSKLQEADAAGAKTKLITTDGVFSMDGSVAKLDKICDLADEFGALVHFDDCHATGFWGPTGRGTHEHCGVMGRIDITTGTFGKALGGASGGYTSGRKEIIDLLRQRSRPYLFSNTLAPAIVGGSLKALEIASRSTDLRDKLMKNTELFRSEMTEAGFDILPGEHPIVPIMLGDARLATSMADKLLELGIYVIGFYYPVVPMGKARIRVQISAAHSEKDLRGAVEKFKQAKAVVA
ncbi:glycine C-acetyltransferase [Aeoliella mucimassa]|uniref:2-amino-3-ketobutyrate coenzyme A ligase n=1 Tax=Aeoliella mucimassa TaxID=2527972 RepID=A0A518AWC8_9BACT|nr:glycine C-acetyltransferase [Aeoliella mucimassa]QDU59045.1 2-amino-3-ketobutyrate coenzyme A ligase [Aeoliella mucimassa]